MRRDSARIISIRRASLFRVLASAQALGEGSISDRRAVRPSDFETIFWATTRTSPRLKIIFAWRAAARISPARSSPFWISGILGMGRIVISVAAGPACLLEVRRDFLLVMLCAK